MNTDEMGLEPNSKGTKRGQITEQVVELSMNRQIYDSIKQRGSDGVAVTEVDCKSKTILYISYILVNKKIFYFIADFQSSWYQ